METIETYDDGQLVEVREFYLNPVPAVANFNTQMMLSASYSRLTSNTSNQEAKNRLEIAAVRLELKNDISNEDLMMFKFIWDAVVGGVPDGILTLTDIDEFNHIAESNNMLFRFGDDFKMIIGET
jgi:hypothetical protein